MKVRNEIRQVAKLLVAFTVVVILPPVFGLFVIFLHGHFDVLARAAS